MKKTVCLLLSAVTALSLLAACGGSAPAPAQTEAPAPPPVQTVPPTPEPEPTPAPTEDVSSKVATAKDMTTVEEVVEEGMVPVPAEALKGGTYPIEVKSSSSMFKIAGCELTVRDSAMTAMLTMSGYAYPWLYMGTALEAAAAPEEDYIPYQQNGDGPYVFTIPVEALDAGIKCAAYSKNKELWYDRTLLFRADSLPMDAFADGFFTTPASLGLAEGDYTVKVSLSGGSGKASVASPALMRVTTEGCFAAVEWSSSNYDYMRIEEQQYLPVNTEGNSAFEIPVRFFDRPMTVYADTTAMSTPHEIEYTLTFDSSSIQPVAG